MAGRGRHSVWTHGLVLAAIGPLLCACATQPTPALPPPAIATPTPIPPRRLPPAAAVPDQPFTGQIPEVEKPYADIIRLREGGSSNEALLQKVRRENIRYDLSIFEIQKLRAARVSENVIEAMLASGRAERTPTPRGP